MRVLGIETSCDETAAAIIEKIPDHKPKILSNVVYSQINQHKNFGGVVPELAARAHVEKLDSIIRQTCQESNCALDQIDAVAVSAGPGLIGGLMIGLISAKTICLALNKPLVAINHLEAHALTARLTNQVSYPYLLLLISGGHTQLLLIKSLQNYQLIGSTIDDALGEAFDKTAKLLGLGYPGGAALEQCALAGDKDKYKFPQPLKHSHNFDLSFSGLKTAVRQVISQKQLENNNELTLQEKSDIAASFQNTICQILEHKVSLAMQYFQLNYPKFAKQNTPGKLRGKPASAKGAQSDCSQKSYEQSQANLLNSGENKAEVDFMARAHEQSNNDNYEQ